MMAAGVVAAPLSARQLEPSEALSRAEMYVPTSVRTPLNSGSAQQPLTLKYTATDRTESINTVYVFGRGDNGGFVVVAADDVVPNPLLGYADSGEFDASDLPPALEWWLGEYSAEISALASGSDVSQTDSEDADTRASIAPIVKTTWNQTTPYNDYCPVVQGVRGNCHGSGDECVQVSRYRTGGAFVHSLRCRYTVEPGFCLHDL